MGIFKNESDEEKLVRLQAEFDTLSGIINRIHVKGFDVLDKKVKLAGEIAVLKYRIDHRIDREECEKP